MGKSMSGPVLKLTDKVDDVRVESVKDTLERSLRRLEKDSDMWEETFQPTHCVVILVDRHVLPDGQRGFILKDDCSAMATSDEVAILEICKHRVMKERLL